MTYIIVEEPVSKGAICSTFANSLKKQYYCQKCKSAFSKLCYLRLHMKLHTFRCTLCSRRYFYKSLLRRHIDTEHNFTEVKDEEKFECEKCSQVFLTKHEYTYHQWTDHLFKFPCVKRGCRMAFKTREEYDYHQKETHPEKFRCLKFGCRMEFITKEERKDHTQKFHPVKLHCLKRGCRMVFYTKEERDEHNKNSHPIRCVKIDCPMVFHTKEEYNDHKMKEHRTRQCKICDKVLVVGAFSKHKKVHQPKHVLCKICNTYFRWREDLQRHLLLHLKIKQFNCNYCGKSFTQKGNLATHIKTHTGQRPHKCKICHFSFARKDVLKGHEKAVHGGKEARKFSCGLCKFTSVSQAHVNTHKKRMNHYGDKKRVFQCEVCSAVLRCQNSLERHSWTHTDNKPFPCPYCSRQYATKHNYTRHLKSAHQ